MASYTNISTTRKEKFIEILDSHKRMIYKIVNTYCVNQEDRKDLEQEIIIQLWKSFDNYNPDFSYSTWIYRIALNVAISFFRKQKSWRSRFDPFPEETLFNIQDEEKFNSERDDKLILLQQLIQQLDELSKALMLLYLDGKRHDEIAEILGISKTNVATKISRLKVKLSKSFENE